MLTFRNRGGVMTAFEMIMASVIFAVISAAIFVNISINNKNVSYATEREKINTYYNEFSEEVLVFLKKENLSVGLDILDTNTKLENLKNNYANKKYVEYAIMKEDTDILKTYYVEVKMVSPKNGVAHKYVIAVPKGSIINEDI